MFGLLVDLRFDHKVLLVKLSEALSSWMCSKRKVILYEQIEWDLRQKGLLSWAYSSFDQKCSRLSWRKGQKSNKETWKGIGLNEAQFESDAVGHK